MRLQVKCVKCKKVLGYYEGEEFYIVSENGAWTFLIEPKVKVLCSECWNKRKSHSHDSAIAIKKVSK